MTCALGFSLPPICASMVFDLCGDFLLLQLGPHLRKLMMELLGLLFMFSQDQGFVIGIVGDDCKCGEAALNSLGFGS